ncbi:expressed protein, partial [Phakopsora pachyrhizi]
MSYRSNLIIKIFLFTLSTISCLKTSQLDNILNKRDNSKEGLYTYCSQSSIQKECNKGLDELWDTERMKSFTTEKQFFTAAFSKCKLTWWTDDGVFRLDDKSRVQRAIQEMQDACAASGISAQNPNRSPGKGIYVGTLGGDKHVSVIAEIIRIGKN